MALAIVKEDGTGLTTANAYNTVAEAETFFADWAMPKFLAASASAKIRYLIEGTRIVETKCAHRVTGSVVTDGQALLFPRYGAVDFQFRAFESDEVPVDFAEACLLMTERVAEAAASGVRTGLAHRSEIIASESTDGHSLSYRRGATFWSLYPEVWERVRRAFPPGVRADRA